MGDDVRCTVFPGTLRERGEKARERTDEGGTKELEGE
jgi:hypothetical protein